ncbi:MAG: hypothetical protein ABSC76_01585 [Terracidiphilus sp.]|jgi:hypothetical protein
MNIHAIFAWCIWAGFIPFLFVVVVLIHFCWVRYCLWRRRHSGGKSSMLVSCCLAMGMGFLQVMWLFYRPSVAYIMRVQEDEDADEDDEGDPENLTKQLNKQLKRIRRGEPVDRLVLRL